MVALSVRWRGRRPAARGQEPEGVLQLLRYLLDVSTLTRAAASSWPAVSRPSLRHSRATAAAFRSVSAKADIDSLARSTKRRTAS